MGRRNSTPCFCGCNWSNLQERKSSWRRWPDKKKCLKLHGFLCDKADASIMHLGWPTSKIEAPPSLLNWEIKHWSPNTKGQLPCKGVGIYGHGKEKRVKQQRTTCCRAHRRWVWALDCLQLWRQNGRDTNGPLLCANCIQRKGKWNYQSHQENLHLVKSKLMK